MPRLSQKKLSQLLNEKAAQYNQPFFIEHDPIQIPKRFTKKEDIEISAFITATIAWGQRITIINNAKRFMAFMGNSPHDFILNHEPKDLIDLQHFVHRTFNGTDALGFVSSLQHVYKNCGGLENAFAVGKTIKEKIISARSLFFEVEHLPRTQKHFSNPAKGSSAKRINMFLRWMVRKDERGVDFGLWNSISPSTLMCPLDVHSGNVARKLGLLKRKQNDWQAVEELTETLKRFDAQDPVKYDFALFGIGAFEKI